MDPEPGEQRDFPEPDIIVNDNVAHPFSSPIHAQTVNRPLNDLPGINDTSFYSDITFESAQSILSEPDIRKTLMNNDKEKKLLIKTTNDIKENFFIEDIIKNLKEFHIKKFDLIFKNLNEKFKYLKIECEQAQQITIHFENQLINVKNVNEKLNFFCTICRNLIISILNIHQNPNLFTLNQLEILTTYIPNSDRFLTSYNNSKQQLEYSHLLINLLKQANKLQIQIKTLYDLLIKSVLTKNERFNEIEQSLRLPFNIFNNNSLYDLFHYEITTTTIKQNVYISSFHNQFIHNDIHIISTDNSKHLLSQINYNACEKYSYIFDIEFKRAITSIDQVTIAIPCFTLPSELQSTQQKIYIRCKRIMDPLIHIPAMIETYNNIPYAIFRLTHSLSAISVEAVLLYPFEILQMSNNGSNCVYTSEYSSIFRIETPKNYFIRPPRVRIIPFNNELIQCMIALKSEDQLLASSDLIEFEWYKETKMEGIISITVSLTRQFALFNETNDDIQKRRRKARKKISLQRKKFEQEKYDEAGGSLATTPTSSHGLTTPTVMSHLPSIGAIIERTMTERQEHIINPKFDIIRDNNTQSISQNKISFKWKLDGFKNENAPIILLGYKNRKWRNCNNFATIIPTSDKNIYIISLTTLLDRIILIRCWPESNNDGKFDKLAENLWSLTSTKLFSCVLARDPSSINTLIHYALIIVPIQKQGLAEDILRKRNYTEYIFDEQLIHYNDSKTQFLKINQYQSHHTLSDRTSLHSIAKYVQFCLSEGTYIRIVAMGNIDIHEKVELSFRLHAQYPVVIEFDVYPIDIYRQKTDDDFIGTLNIYQINTHSITLGSTSSTLTAAVVSSRTSSGSKDIEISDGLPINSSPRPSVNGPETISNIDTAIGRTGFERLSIRDLNETNLVCAIRIRLPKAAFQLPSTQSNKIPFMVPDYFKSVLEALTEGKREFAEALNIHPALMNSLLTSLTSQQQRQQRENYSQSSTSLYENSKINIIKDDNTTFKETKFENETLLNWLKRQSAFKIDKIKDNIISALIHIGRVDLAYIYKIENLRNKCESL